MCIYLEWYKNSGGHLIQRRSEELILFSSIRKEQILETEIFFDLVIVIGHAWEIPVASSCEEVNRYNTYHS